MHGSLFSSNSSTRRHGTNQWQLGSFSQQTIIGLVFAIALFAFEMFNFDTTRYALNNLLGGVTFVGLGWATILAIAFCAIDFAGLAHLFTPQRGREEPKEVWFLMGAWLLGATMNALMTWWAVSLTLLNHPFIGNEVLTRAQLLEIVPIFVAVLVWLTRIMFIGSLSVAGEQIFQVQQKPVQQQPVVQVQQTKVATKRQTSKKSPAPSPSTPYKNRRTSTHRPPVGKRPVAGVYAKPYRQD